MQARQPADPFGGSFDIFDVIEQAEMEQASRPLQTSTATPARLSVESAPVVDVAEIAAEPIAAEHEKPKRTRGRRSTKALKAEAAAPVAAEEVVVAALTAPTEEEAPAKPKRPRTRRTTKATEAKADDVVVEAMAPEASAPVAEEEATAKPKRTRARRATKAVKADDAAADDGNTLQPINIDELPPVTRRMGWWKR